MSKHLLRYVSGYCHDGLVACLRLSKFGDSVMSQVMEAETIRGTLDLAYVRFAFRSAANLTWVLPHG